MNKPKYSILIYCNQLLKTDMDYISECLSNGIIVHLFFKGIFKNFFNLNENNKSILHLALENKLMFVYDNQGEVWEKNVVIAGDGEIYIPQLYNKICNIKNSDFNNSQYEIITADKNDNYIVMSGAGTGKTTTMINRLMYLKKTSDRFTFDKVALITFTNKSTVHMREKLINLIEQYYIVTKDIKYLEMMDEAIKCNITTIHGFSKKLINNHGKNININRNINIKPFRYYRKKSITESLQYLYENHNDIYEKIKYYPLYDVENRLLSLWDKLDNFSIDVTSKKYEVNFGEDNTAFSKFVGIVITKAQEFLNEYKEYNFEITDLMKKLDFKELFYDAKDEYELIMVDEFQDSDNIQIDFITNFCNITGAKLLVVGDEKQSIYRFRGAEHTAFYRLDQGFKKNKILLKKFTMVRNYRTNANLLKEINDIFINIDKRVDEFNYKQQDYIYSLVNKELNSKIEYISLGKDDKEDEEFYLNLLEEKSDDEYIAVLFRSNKDVKLFKDFCDRKSIPCRVDVSGGFFRHEAVRDFYIMIRALIDTDSNNIMYSFINTPYINEKINKEKIIVEDSEEVSNYLKSILKEKSWSTYQDLVSSLNILELIDIIIETLKPVKQYYSNEFLKAKLNKRNPKKIAYIKTLEYKLNLEHLLYIIKDKFSDKVSSIFVIEEFLRFKISTDNTVDIRKPHACYENKFLQCSTIHKAKGLEYDYVVMPKLTNKFITNQPVDVIIRNEKNKVKVGFKIKLGEDEYTNSYYFDYLKDEKNQIIGEEARLLYVAMTRCKKKLFLNAKGIIATESINNWKSLIGGSMSNV